MSLFKKALFGNLGMTLLAVWLILYGVLNASFLGIRFSQSGDIPAVLAAVTGVFLWRRG